MQARFAEGYEPAGARPALERDLARARTWLTVVAVIAVAALGLAIGALLQDNNNSSRNGSGQGLATQSDVAALNSRIDRLSREVNALGSSANAGKGSTASLSARMSSLEKTVQALSGRATSAASAQQLSQLSTRVDKLAADVAQLQQNAGQTTTTTP